MVAEFTVIRDGVKNLIDIQSAPAARVIYIDASTYPRDITSGSAIKIIYNDGLDLAPSFCDVTKIQSRDAVGEDAFLMFRIWPQTPPGEYSATVLFEVTTGGAGQWTSTEKTNFTFIMGTFQGLPAATGMPLVGLVSMSISDSGCAVPGAPSQLVSIIDWSESRNLANSISQYKAYNNVVKVLATQTSPFFMQYNQFQFTGSPTITGNVIDIYCNNRMSNTSIIIGDVYGYYFWSGSGSSSGLRATVSGSIYCMYTAWEAACGTASVTNLVSYMSAWDVSGVIACTGYSAVISANINANSRTFDVYGARIDIDGTMAGTATWRGYYLNANGVTCGATRFFYGLDIDMSAMNTGGTVVGIRCIVINSVPAMVLGDGTGTLTVDFGAGNHPNVNSSTGRIYFGTQLAGSAAADDIYCHNVLQVAPWAENTWDSLDDLGILREINTAISEQRTPQLPRQFTDKFNTEGYYNRLQMDALERGAILKLEERIKHLEEAVTWLKTK